MRLQTMTADVHPARADWRNYAILKWKAFLNDREDQVFLLLTLLIGALVGLIVVAFIEITGRFGARLYPPDAAAWRRFLVPVIGSLVMGYLLYKYFPDARGSGVPQTKAALYARGGFISFPTLLGKFFCTSVTLASGIPLGREGPAVQVGGGIASVLGRALGLRPERVKELLPVGAAAAVAAAFNTPLAAVLFSLEEVVGDLHAPVLGSVVLASATSWGVLRLLLGNEPLFQVPQYQLVTAWELIAYGLLGIAGGVVSAVFTQLLLRLRVWFKRQPAKTVWFQPVAGGLVVGVMGWFVPSVMGVGYQYVGDVLNDSLTLKLMLTLLVLKLVATAVSYASGNAGGIFGPSLFLGAMLGGAVGSVAQHFFPGHVAAPGAYALVGMGAAFAGIVRAPMTSVVMIFEITRDYAVIVPLMISNLVSYFISSRLQKEPIYEVLAEQDGIHLPKFGSRQQTRRQVMQIMQPAGQALSAEETIGSSLERTRGAAQRTWIVSNSRGVAGLVTREELANAANSVSPDSPIGAILKAGDFPHVHADHPLDEALHRLGANQVDLLPVVSRANVHQLLGVVRLQDVLEAYGVAVKAQA
ncbi:MAG TPA: chloride channel protein [Candidatus Acidoferrum sp.]|nr:chloride channel protein [Candidatus Acidoferrum sp.]